ncbi:MAG: hypothetical protein ACKVX9_01625 [Blastocatellia bacterium]
MELTIRIEDAAKVELVREIFKRFSLADGVDVSVDPANGYILVKPATADAGLIPIERLVEQAFLQEETNPMTDEEAAAIDRELAEYGAQKAKEFGIEDDEDVYLLLNEHKREQRAKLTA